MHLVDCWGPFQNIDSEGFLLHALGELQTVWRMIKSACYTTPVRAGTDPPSTRWYPGPYKKKQPPTEMISPSPPPGSVALIRVGTDPVWWTGPRFGEIISVQVSFLLG
jgi:hypothetical protein